VPEFFCCWMQQYPHHQPGESWEWQHLAKFTSWEWHPFIKAKVVARHILQQHQRNRKGFSHLWGFKFGPAAPGDPRDQWVPWGEKMLDVGCSSFFHDSPHFFGCWIAGFRSDIELTYPKTNASLSLEEELG
jgi:hypothetical protein